jgi:hypothetical protein
MGEDVNVRIGTPEDIHGIMEIALDMWEELGVVPPSTDKILGEVWEALNQENGLIGIIGDSGGRIEGGVLLRIGSLWYSDDKVLEERGIFIHRDFRAVRGGRARRLCEFSKETADTLGIPLLIGILSDHRTQAKAKLYERQFGKPSGAFFLYGGKTGSVKED